MNPELSYSEILELIDSFDPVQYAKTRNHLRGGVSRLSPYITRGVISLPAVRNQILKKYQLSEVQKFIQELAWREYFQKVYLVKGKKIFSDLRFSRHDWQHNEVVTAIDSAITGIEAVDKAILELKETGYMHNHARLWTAMLACNVARAHWLTMSKWMYYHLLDGDLAPNTLSWQWVAGTSIQKQYFVNQALINACSDTKQTQTYLDRDTKIISIPKELVTHNPFLYKMIYPTSDEVGDVTGQTVLLYHPFSIDPLWRKDELEAQRIFVIEPRLFDNFPISPLVLEHMLKLLKTHVPTAKIFVGNVETIAGIKSAKVFSKTHPATTHFPGNFDDSEELFPQVKGEYQSFFKFWNQCQSQL